MNKVNLLPENHFEVLFKEWVDSLPIIKEQNSMVLPDPPLPIYQNGPSITEKEAWFRYGNMIVKKDRVF